MEYQIKNLEKAAKRILRAVKNKENIIIYADADLDGVASAIILEDCLKSLGWHASKIYFPDRETEGYGITETGLKKLKEFSPALFLALDCGIGNFKEVEKAKKMGFEVIIIDHHEILDKLPSASIIVDPKQKGDKYPFKQLATVGLVFKLTEVVLKEKMTENLRNNFLELTALATIADMMPRTDDNQILIQEGLACLEKSWRPGIQALLNLKEFTGLSLLEKVNKINSLLNVRDIKNDLPAAFRLLTCPDRKKSEKLARELFEKGKKRKERIKEILEELERKIFGKSEEPIIFEGSPNWELVLLGVVASLLSKKYKKPVFLYKKGEKESQGGIRAPVGFNVVEAMRKCSKNLITFGGHPQAAGFRIKNKHLEDFKECLFDYFMEKF